MAGGTAVIDVVAIIARAAPVVHRLPLAASTARVVAAVAARVAGPPPDPCPGCGRRPAQPDRRDVSAGELRRVLERSASVLGLPRDWFERALTVELEVMTNAAGFERASRDQAWARLERELAAVAS
jgi:hypothetical protein